MKKVYITTLGCAKNQVDSEVMRAQLNSRNYDFAAEPQQADFIIINTCGFIIPAKEESLQAIFEALEIKKQNRDLKVLVCGCLAQRYKQELSAGIGEVDAFFGTEDYGRILSYLGENNFQSGTIYLQRARNSSGHYAYIKISEGCNHTCAFCTIPAIRGSYRSRRLEDILAEAQLLAGRGVKEIILISQDTSYYGKDLYGEQRIVELAAELAAFNKFTWIRTLYWYPSNFPLSYLELMNKYPSIIPYLDMPVQHVSDRVLGRMRRAETEASLTAFYKKVREIRPDIALRTTLLLGHPGEQADDFKRLREFVKKICFDRLGTFVYSDEEGSAAFQSNDKVPAALAVRRRNQIMKVQQRIALQKNEQLLDTIQQVLVDNWHEDQQVYSGRTYRDAPDIDNEVIIRGAGKQPDLCGTFQQVRIDDASEYELYGTVVV